MKTNVIIGRTDQILDKNGKTLDKVIGKGGGSDEPVEVIELNITHRIYDATDGIASFNISNWADVKDKVLNYIINGKTNYIVAKVTDNQVVYYVRGLQITLAVSDGVYDFVEIGFLFGNPSSVTPVIVIHNNMFLF